MIPNFADIYLDNQSKFKVNDLIKLFLILYIPLKIIIVIALIYLVPIFFNKSYFDYADFISNYTSCDLTSPNLLFNLLVCSFGFQKIDNISLISIAFILNAIKDFGFLLITLKSLTKRYLMLFLLLIILHPYLNLYQARFTTDIFASLAVFFVFFMINFRNHTNIFYDVIIIIFTGFRNSLLIIFLFYYGYKLISHLVLKINYIKKIRYLSYLFIVLIFFILITQNDLIFKLLHGNIGERNYNTLNYFIATNIYNININYFLEFINTSSVIIDYIASIIILVAINLILLMGFREAAFTTFPDYFLQNDFISIISILIGFAMFLLHFIGLICFIKYFVFKKLINLCFIFFILFHLLTISHLRYFLPIIPLSLLGFVLYFEIKNKSYKILNNNSSL